MRKPVASDLSSEMPSDRVPPGRHHFEGVFRIPVLGCQFTLAARSPDRAPAAVAPAVLAFSGPSLAWAALAALAAVTTRLPSWTVLGAAVLFAATMGGVTYMALWYQHKRSRLQDLTELEGNPTDRADVLIEEQQVHRVEIRTAHEPLVAVTCTSSARSLPGLGMAFLTLATAALIPATAFIGLARLIPASALLATSAVILVFISAAACGIAMMIRIEQLGPDSGHSDRSVPGNSSTPDALDTETPPPEPDACQQ